MAFSPPVVGCLVKKGFQKGGSRAPQDPPWLRPWCRTSFCRVKFAVFQVRCNKRIVEVFLWSPAACRLVVNAILSPNYHYWIKSSIVRQNCMMTTLRFLVCTYEEKYLFTKLNYSRKSELNIPFQVWCNKRIFEVFLWSPAACRLPSVVNAMLYHPIIITE